MSDIATKTIAIIEDELPIAQMYRIKLELAGYRVVVAENGETGLKMVEDVNPDLVLLDIMMPYMNGDELLKKLRDNEKFSHLPVMILTNVGDTDLQERIEKYGVASYIQKADMTPRQVLAKVNAVMGRENISGESAA
jgi:DNA-binding response OmpR family regulator